ncbi:MAG: polysaccharide deacetylase family protein [Clostridia bacterium]|nr:polysaccharide deacetylase family protein [Clostridia bacterium]
MRRSHVISLFVMFAAVSVFVVIMAFVGKNPKQKIAAPTATNQVIIEPTLAPTQETTGTPAATETVTPAPTEEPTEEPTQEPVVRPVINASDFYDYSTKEVEFSVYNSRKVEDDPESMEFTVDSAALKVLDGYEYIYRKTDGPEKTVYITFNLGYEDKNGSTLKILDSLDRAGVKATFFIAKNYFEENADTVAEIVKRGHLVGSRGDIFAKGSGNKTGMVYLTPDKFSDTMWSIEELYQGIAGENTRMSLYRPEKFSVRDLALAEAMGYTVVFRSYSYYDWDDSVDRNKALRSLQDNTCSGVVLQLSSSKVNSEILEDYITWAKDKGYSFAALNASNG